MAGPFEGCFAYESPGGMSTSQISRALSNVGEFPDTIETVPRGGYRIAAISVEP